jgi:hypothetical protein
VNPRAVPVLFGAICLVPQRWDTHDHWEVAQGPSKAPTGRMSGEKTHARIGLLHELVTVSAPAGCR